MSGKRLSFVLTVVLWLCVAVAVCFIACMAMRAMKTSKDRSKTIETLTDGINEAKQMAEQDGYIIQSVMSAVMASATNNIADMEPGSLMDCIAATCRVRTVTKGSSYSLGTGVVFEISNGKVYIITNAHVATTSGMMLEFWKDGHKTGSIAGKTILRDRKRDVAVIAVDITAFDGWLPTAIPLAPRDTVLSDGQEVLSAGCPRGEWTKAWVGHVLYYEGKNKRVVFLPPPFGGQSGSAIFSADGTCIVALLNLQELNSQGKSIRGMAVNIQEIYDAIYGKVATETEIRYNQRGRTKGFFGRGTPSPSQCGPRGCPAPDRSKPAPSQGTGGLRPEIPFVLPEVVVIPDLSELPEVEPLPDGSLDVPIMSDDARAARQAVIDRNQHNLGDYRLYLWMATAFAIVVWIILIFLISRAERRKRK